MEAVESLVIQPTLREVRDSFHNMVVGKHSGPDGLGDVPSSVNATTLSLIPMVVHPSSIKDYRPLSSSNNLYKAVTKELVQGYHKEDGVPKAAIKVDLQKAYNMVERESLWTGMEAMDFPQWFIFLLQCCITKAHFSTNINGTLKGWFTSSRGLQQGDPISSYLFVLVLEIFNGLMMRAREDPSFRFHPKCLELGIRHLSFTDDMVLLA
ncbi:hypothetical protein LIER_21349 [Lithospermum erythrorhizon]|uniref:Reverse transcriptase domain-containing protein n=1 Tax=Lithospermum erythrorhizon TaxID=34254 RepID=A0AAV3QQX5_LITER